MWQRTIHLAKTAKHHSGWLASGLLATTLGMLALTGSAGVQADEGREHGKHLWREHSYLPDQANSGLQGRQQPVRQPMPKAYQQECASCHMAFEPRFLPAASWQRIMGNLKNHYGTDASIDAETAASITQWLLPQAGSYRRVSQTPPPEDRITRSAWFVRKHDEIPQSVFKRASIKSASNCMACHTGTDKGQYDEDWVRIPK